MASPSTLSSLFAGLRLSPRPVLRSTYLPSIPPSQLSTPSSSASFHTSTSLFVSRRKIIARRKKAKVLATRSERQREEVKEMMDPILGDFKQELINASLASSSGSGYGGNVTRRGGADRVEKNSMIPSKSKWEDSLLKKVVLDKNDIWYTPPPSYPDPIDMSNEFLSTVSFPLTPRPTHFSQHLNNKADQDLLFGQLPTMTVEHLNRNIAINKPEDGLPAVRNQVESTIQLMKILDLRNADSRGIRAVNTRRIIEVFGASSPSSSSQSNVGSSEIDSPPQNLNTGNTLVQAALLTHRIRLLQSHLSTNTRDVHNRKNLRTMVHQRQKLLRYWKKRCMKEGGEGLEGYVEGLEKLGLDARAVEGELIVR